MNLFQQFVHQPRKLWLRRAVFQVHLWTGLGLGLYIFMISVTGFAIVFRPQITAAMMPKPLTPAKRMSLDELTKAVQAAYPGYKITEVVETKRIRRPDQFALERPGDKKRRYFDPYTGRDLGDVTPTIIRVLEWTVDLHDNLLGGATGRVVNGAASIAVTLLCLTGAVIWWPGSKRWKQSLILQPRTSWRRFNWQLHSTTGFWIFSLLLLWSLTGIYFGFPHQVEAIAAFVAPGKNANESSGEVFVASMIKYHFGRFGGLPIRILWVILGLLPAILVVTGALMWWNRVLRPRLRRAPLEEAPAMTVEKETIASMTRERSPSVSAR